MKKRAGRKIGPGSRNLKPRLQALGLVWLFLTVPLYREPQALEAETAALSAADSADRESAMDSVPGTAPLIAITFDDGPDAEWTPVLLDGLKERGVKATFFLIGANISQDGNESLVRRMYAEGHLIGNHTYHHVNLAKLSSSGAEEELGMTDQLIEEITGAFPFLVRPPFGAFPQGEEEPDKLYVKWTVDSSDWVTKNTAEIVRKVVTDVEENDIILMHDCYETSVEAALQIVDILKDEGYEFVTLDKLLID